MLPHLVLATYDNCYRFTMIPNDRDWEEPDDNDQPECKAYRPDQTGIVADSFIFEVLKRLAACEDAMEVDFLNCNIMRIWYFPVEKVDLLVREIEQEKAQATPAPVHDHTFLRGLFFTGVAVALVIVLGLTSSYWGW